MQDSKKVAKRIIILSFVATILLSFSICVEAKESSNLTPPLDVLWEYKFENVCSAFEISNTSIYVASSQIYAFNAGTGQVIWKYNSSGSTIHYSNNTIYTGDTLIYALNATNGLLEWSYDINGTLDDIVVKNGVIYAIAKEPASLYAINQASGEELWTYNTNYDNIYSHYIHNNIIILRTATFEDKALNPYEKIVFQAINISNGVQMWEWENKSIVINDVLFSNDTNIIVSTFPNNKKVNFFQPYSMMYSINTSTAETNWELKIQNFTAQFVNNNSIYILNRGCLKSLNVITGKVNWEIEMQDPKYIAIRYENVYVCSNDKLYSLSDHGKLNWVFQTRDTYKIFNTTSLRIEDIGYDAFRVHFLDNTVYLFSNNNFLYSLNPSGKLNWDVQLKDFSSKSQFFSSNGMLYIIGDTIQIIDKNGTILQEIKKDGSLIEIINDKMVLYTKDRTITILSSEKNVGPYAVKVAQSAINASEEKTNITHAQEIYTRARGALFQEDYSNATIYSKEAKQSVILPYISDAESSIRQCKFLFADTVTSEKQLENAKTAYINNDFPSAIDQAIAAKKSADHTMKTRLIQYILIIFILIFIIILFNHYGFLKGIVALAKFIPLPLILLCIVSFLIWIYLAFTSLNLITPLMSQKPVIPIFGLFYGSLLILPFLFTIFYDNMALKFIRHVFLLLHVLLFIPSFIFIGFAFTYFAMVRHMYQTGELISNQLIFILDLFDPLTSVVLLVAISIFVSLFLYVFYIFITYRNTWTLAAKANKYRKQGDYNKAIEF